MTKEDKTKKATENTLNLQWDYTEDCNLFATVNFGTNGYASFFIEPVEDGVTVETQVFNSQDEGFDGRCVYFKDEDQAKNYINVMADMIFTISRDKTLADK